MGAKISFGKMQLDVSLGANATARQREPERPFLLALAGDLSGRANRGQMVGLADRPMRPVDCDNLETVMGRLEAKLQLPVGGAAVEVSFKSVEDFHPDQLLRQIPALAALLDLRKQLLDPTKARSLLHSARSAGTPRGGQASTPPPGSTASSAAPSSESHQDTLARLMGRPAAPSSPQPTDIASRFIQHVVGPSIIPAATSEQAAQLSALDLELATLLRGLLHHPDFQALEATWRGAEFLVRNFGGDERIKLLLLDVSKAELTADLGAQELLDNSGLWRVLHRQADKAPLAVCVGLFTFCGSIADIELLGRLANISHQIGAPLLAGASPDLAGCDSFQAHPDRADWKAPLSAEVSEAWRVLRELPQAGAVGLALPRFLCRLPYGGKSLPIESFPFEEMPDAAEHESYLWGNSALLCSYLLAEAFRAEGWSLSAGGYGEVGDMPVHKLSGEEENEVKPCAEAWLNQPAADTLAGLGLMPVLSIRGRDAVRVDRVQSLAGRAFQIG